MVSLLTFVLVSVTPGDAAREILGVQAPPEAYAKLRAALGLDLPLQEQYWNWLSHAATGDFGSSLFTQEPVLRIVLERLPVTLSLMLGALLVSLIAGIGVGVLSAVRGGMVGRVLDSLSMLAFSLPSFWLGLGLITIFAVTLGWFPATGYVPISDSFGDWIGSLFLPVLALSVNGIAAIQKQTREAMTDALGSEYVRALWAHGVRPRSIYLRHALKNAALPIVTVLGVQTVSLLGGTVLVENVFALPGLGSLTVTASLRHDLPLITGLAVVFTLMVVVINLVVDALYAVLNPRISSH